LGRRRLCSKRKTKRGIVRGVFSAKKAKRGTEGINSLTARYFGGVDVLNILTPFYLRKGRLGGRGAREK